MDTGMQMVSARWGWPDHTRGSAMVLETRCPGWIEGAGLRCRVAGRATGPGQAGGRISGGSKAVTGGGSPS